jgi:ABC-type sugar transport system ATPase subunit
VIGRDVVLGVRAEHVILGPEGDRSGKVRLTEPLGDASLVFFDCGLPTPLVAKVPPDSKLGPGDNLSFRFVPENCHIFDAAAGARLH